MLFGNRGPRPSRAGRSKVVFRPRGENLEAKILMAFDLGSAAPPALPNIATGNVGIDMANTTANQGAGTSVANLGDINGTGYDSFLIGAPNGTTPSVYLVFGSRNQATAGANPVLSDWLNTTVPLVTNLGPNGRVGDLATLGTAGQVNPISGVGGNPPDGYSFSGLTFTSSSSSNSQLGFSVANAGFINGTQAFLIGAPNALAIGNSAASVGSGRVYLVYGNANLLALAGSQAGVPIDLDNPPSGINVVTFGTSVLGSRLGASVAGIGNFLNDGSNGIALGATNVTVGTGGTANSGAVYIATSNGIPTATNTTPVDVSKFGQAGGTAGLVLAGAGAGNRAGFSVSGAGDVNGDGLGDLLIGAPSAAGGNGTSYLVYGGNLNSLVTFNFQYNFISLARVGQPTGSSPAPVPGAAISGGGGNGTEASGSAVASAGDFNSDGISDIMIGSPNFSSGVNTNQGRVTVLYGGRNNVINGIFPLTAVPASISTLSLIGNNGDRAGFALGNVAPINIGQTNEILIGAPGNSLAYLLPGHGGTYTGTFQLSDAENPATLAGVQFTATTPLGATAFGTSVSGRLLSSGQIHTADLDIVGDFIIGAPTYSIGSSSAAAGGGFIVQGAMITLGIPPATNVITTTITQIDSSTTSPFAVNPVTPDAMQIFVTNSTTPTGLPFVAATDIDPTTITVNGVLFANATVAADPNNPNQAIITISPRSALGLSTGNSTLVVAGKTLASSAEGVLDFQGTAAINGGGGGGGGGGSVVVGAVSSPLPPGLFTPVSFLSQFGGSFVPTIASMSQYNYAPIPASVALSQYLPPAGFRQRIQAFHGQTVQGRKQNASRKNDTGTGVWTLGRSVYNRGRFHNGNTYQWVHSGLVLPTTRKVQRFSSAGNKLPG